MTTYLELKTHLQNFVNLKLEYVSLLKQCKLFNYNLDIQQELDYKQWIEKELKTEQFKTKYYKLYLEQLSNALNIYFNITNEDNLDTSPSYIINDENKSDIINLDELTKHKSLHKRIKLFLKDYGNTFHKKEIKPLTLNLDKCKNIITLFNHNNTIYQDDLTDNNNDLSNNDNNLSNNDNDKLQIFENSEELKDNLDTTRIEAIPKNLAEKGDRPGNDNPIGQKIYDLQLLHGFGEKTAQKFVEEKSITLEKLLEEWNRFIISEGNDDTLMIERLPDDPTINNGNWSHSRLMGARFKYLQDRMEAEGCHSLIHCNHEQLIGIKYFYDMCEKIPRAEIIKMEKFVQIVVKHINPEFIIGCCGSYRRGRDRSGDMDCLLTHPELKTQEDIDEFQSIHGNILTVIVDLLTKKGFLTDHLTEGGRTKYMGLCKLPNRPEYKLHRRIDIRFVPYNSYGTALLYFTGSKNFNTQMRNVALQMGYTLSEYGLFHYIYNKEKKKKVKGEQLPTPSEEDVFKVLKMEYKTPQERDI